MQPDYTEFQGAPAYQALIEFDKNSSEILATSVSCVKPAPSGLLASLLLNRIFLRYPKTLSSLNAAIASASKPSSFKTS